MPKYEPRRGLAAIEEAAASKGGAGFRPFVPEISWREDNEKKYILVITPIDEVAELNMHEWIPVGTGEKANGETYTRYEAFLSRKDPMLGEDYDDIEDRLDRKPKVRCYGVAVELEPVLETVKGRQRPKGFVVKTGTYTRKLEDGGEEEVTEPLIGLIVQSSSLMWSPLASLDSAQGPLDELALEVTRRGTDQNTRYDFVPFLDAPVDLSPVIDYLDGVSYLRDDLGDLISGIEATDNDISATRVVADAIYNRRLEELADEDRYKELVDPITEIKDKYGKKKKSNSSRPSRPSRPSPRKSEETEAQAENPVAESQGSRFAALKAQVEGK